MVICSYSNSLFNAGLRLSQFSKKKKIPITPKLLKIIRYNNLKNVRFWKVINCPIPCSQFIVYFWDTV